MNQGFRELLSLEAEYACFNSRRSLVRPGAGVAHWAFRGEHVIIRNADWLENDYVNRVTSFDSDPERILSNFSDVSRIDSFSEPKVAEIHPPDTLSYFRHDLHKPSESESKPRPEIKIEVCRDPHFFIGEIARTSGKPVDPAIVRAKVGFYCTRNFRCTIARLDGEVAGLATLFIHERAGWIANAYTFPKYRNRGVHSELLRYRIEDARGLGLAFAFTDAEPGSVSARNIIRSGFRIVATATTFRV